MRKSLRIPAALAFVVSGTAVIVACGDDETPPNDAVSCAQYCVPSGSDPSNCPSFSVCVSPTGTCPAGCMPEPVI